jgi:DinB superfamily
MNVDVVVNLDTVLTIGLTAEFVSSLKIQKDAFMTNDELYIAVTLSGWRGSIERADKIFGALSDQEVLKEIAPGKNRPIYLLGHLTAIHDAMLPLLGIGRRLHPEFDVAFVSNPDKTQPEIPSTELVRNAWREVNERLFEGFAILSAADWLRKHGAVSEEAFTKEPLRNRLAILLSRTNHLAYHLGQMALRSK